MATRDISSDGSATYDRMFLSAASALAESILTSIISRS
jgi:hypothetical protein